MERLTSNKDVKDMEMYELAHNCMIINNGEAWYRDFENEISLRNMIREIKKKYEGDYNEQLDDDELLDQILLEDLQFATETMSGFIAVFNMIACSHADLREILRRYEDTGLTPEQIMELKEKNTAKQVTEVCGVCGEKYECPNCGSGLRDTDVFVGYCKWCGQKIKLEE